MKPSLYMGTTQISAERTAGEIVSLLVSAGATQINTEYDNGQIKGLRWIMHVSGRGDLLFAMPARVEPVFKIINGSRKDSYTQKTKETEDRAQSTRVAWRQLLRWVQAQLAFIESGMSEASEVFFSYIQHPSGPTLFEAFKDNGFKLLGPASEKTQ